MFFFVSKRLPTGGIVKYVKCGGGFEHRGSNKKQIRVLMPNQPHTLINRFLSPKP